jgi:hypothetical protein
LTEKRHGASTKQHVLLLSRYPLNLKQQKETTTFAVDLDYIHLVVFLCLSSGLFRSSSDSAQHAAAISQPLRASCHQWLALAM